MKKILFILATFIALTFSVKAQTQPVLPPGSQIYSSNLFLAPDSTVWTGKGGLYINLGSKRIFDRLLAGKVDTLTLQSYYTKTQVDAFLSLYYDKTQVDSIANLRYTKTEADLLLGTKIDTNKLEKSNGIPLMDANKKIKIANIPDQLIGAVNYMGTWSPATNTPPLSTIPDLLTKGHYYVASDSGVFNGITYRINDWIISSGSEWQIIEATNTVRRVNGKSGIVEIDKVDVGLGNVDNTSDLNKPISTATQSALNSKEDKSNKVTSFATLNNTLYPTTQAVANYVATQIPAAQTLSQPSIGQLAISGGNTVDLNGLMVMSDFDWDANMTASPTSGFFVRGTNNNPTPGNYFGLRIGYNTTNWANLAFRNSRAFFKTNLNGDIQPWLEIATLDKTVNTSGDQTGIGGNKTTTGVWTFSNLSGTGNALAGLTSNGTLTRTNPNDLGFVPYTGANQAIDFNTQDFTTGGYTRRLHSYFERINLVSDLVSTSSNFKLLTNVAAAGIGQATDQTSDIIITLPITTNTHWQAEIDILRVGYRATLNIGSYGISNLNRFVSGVYGDVSDIIEVKFGRIDGSTVLIIKRSDPTIHRLQVNISKFYYHHTNSEDLYNDKTKYKVEYINESDLVGFTLNGTVTNAEFTRDPYYLDYNNLANKPTISENQTLSLGTTAGEIAISEGNNVSLRSLGYDDMGDGVDFTTMFNALPNGMSFKYVGTNSTGFPAEGNNPSRTLGLYFKYPSQRSSFAVAKGYLSGASENKLYFNTGSSSGTGWGGWQTFASEEWANSQGWAKTSDLTGYVNTTTNQTGIAGNKTWTGAHTFSALSGVGNGLAGLNASGQLVRTELGGLGFVPYTGATQGVNLNTQNFRIGGDFNKSFSNFERSHLYSNETNNQHFTRLTDVASLSIGNDQSTPRDCIVISIPITAGTKWVADVDVFSGTGTSIFPSSRVTTIRLSSYGSSNSSSSVSVTGSVDAVASVAFGRNLANDRTVIIIRPSNLPSTPHFSYGKVNISKFYHGVTYNPELAVKTNYSVTSMLESDLTDFTLTREVTNAEFTRDPYYLDYNNFVNTPTIGAGTLTLATTNGLTGSASFTANQSGNATFTVGVDVGYKLPTTAEWNSKADTSSLATVATSGSYNDLTDKPTLGTAAALNAGTGPGEVRTNAQNDSRYLQSQRYKSVIPVSANRTIAVTDEDCLWIVTGIRTLTVPNNASVAFPIGGRIDVQVNASDTAIIERAVGVTLTHKDGTGNTSREGFTMFTFIKTAENAWTIIGG